VCVSRVFDDDHVMALSSQQAYLVEDSRRVRQQSTFEFGIQPGACNDLRPVMGPHFVFIKVQPCVDGGWVDQSFLDQQTLKSLYPQRGIGRDFLARLVVIVGHANLPMNQIFLSNVRV
jgi:hypothetical protein